MSLVVSSGNHYFALNPLTESAERTLLVWVKPGSVSGTQQLICRDGGGGGTRVYQFRMNGTEVDYIRFVSGVPGSVGTSGAGLATGVWSSVIAVDRGDGDQEVFVDGVSRGTGTDAGAADTLNANLGLGIRKNDNLTVNEPLTGALAHCCSWNYAMSAREIRALAAGYSPDFFRPGQLWHYRFLAVGSAATVRDSTGNIVVTETGTTTDGDHPPIIYPRRSWAPTPSAAAATNDGAAVYHYMRMMGAY